MPKQEDEFTEDKAENNGVADYSGEPYQKIDMKPAKPKPRMINRKLVFAACLITGVLAIGVIYASINKQRSIAQNMKAKEDKANVSTVANGPGSAATLPGTYDELRAYNKRKSTDEVVSSLNPIDQPPQLPASLKVIEDDIALNNVPIETEHIDANDPRLMAARQAAMQRLNAQTAAISGGSNLRPKNGTAVLSQNNRSIFDPGSGLATPAFPQMPGAVDELLHANDQKAKAGFLNQKTDKGVYLNQPLIEPASPYQVMAGNIIPSSLITGLNSDLPGFLTAQVRSNVYDSVTGRYLLIPQGTRIIGEYSSSITYGQNRALVVWNRLIFPNGRSITLEGMPGVDLSGDAGFKDKVNYHFMRLLGSAILGSVVATASDAAKDDDPNSVLNNALSGTATTADQTIQQIIKKQLNVQPTIEIRPGYKFNIVVLADMVLTPYEPAPTDLVR